MPNFKLFLAVLFIGFIISCKTKPPEDTQSLIEQQLRGMENAFKTNPKSVADFYADDAVMISPDSSIYRERKVMEDYWANFKRPVEWKLDLLHLSKTEKELYESEVYQQLANKPPHWDFTGIDLKSKKGLIYQLGHSKLEYETEDDLHRTSHVDFILVWEKQTDGVYRVVVDSYH